jgi:hypothetical protein
MPIREEQWPAGTPCWVDVAVPDIARATAFYGPVLGWTFQGGGEEYDGYSVCLVDGQPAAGVGKIKMAGQPAAWTVYLASDDVDDTTKLIHDNGGSVLVGPTDIPETGRVCIARDPAGGVFGVWQADPMIGAAVYNQPGGLVWEDAQLTDPDAGQRFYQAVFGWSYDSVEGAPDSYRTFSLGAHPLGGIGPLMGTPEGTPSHWRAYFSVADADAATAAATEGGGSVLMAPEDTPFGRIGVLVDPFGAVFGIHAELAG